MITILLLMWGARFLSCRGDFYCFSNDSVAHFLLYIYIQSCKYVFCCIWYAYSLNEPPHDKTNKMICAPSEDSDQPGHPPSLIRVFAVRTKKSGSLATHWAHSEDSDQTGRMPRQIWVFAGCTCHFVGFVMMQLKCIHKLEIFFWAYCCLCEILSLKYLSAISLSLWVLLNISFSCLFNLYMYLYACMYLHL